MTGSNAVLIVVPIVALSTLAWWVGLVFYVGAHPEWKTHRLAREAQAREAQAREVQAWELAAAVAGDQAAVRDTGQEAGTPGPDQAAREPAPRARGGGQARITPRAA
jgi:hypothetical protein